MHHLPPPKHIIYKLYDRDYHIMYIFFTAFLLIIIFFAILNHCRAKSIRKKICCLSTCEKIQQLNDLIAPFGFCYSPCQDIFTSRVDAWQREFGYCALYDQAAPFAQMVIDCEPVYFDYEGRTWLIELWNQHRGGDRHLPRGFPDFPGRICHNPVSRRLRQGNAGDVHGALAGKAAAVSLLPPPLVADRFSPGMLFPAL